MKKVFTDLGRVQSVEPVKVLSFIDSLPFKIEFKSDGYFKNKYYILFVFPDNIKSRFKILDLDEL